MYIYNTHKLKRKGVVTDRNTVSLVRTDGEKVLDHFEVLVVLK